MTTDPGAVPTDALPLALYNFPNRSGNNGSNNDPNISVEDGTGNRSSQNNSSNMTTAVVASGSKNEELPPDKRLYQHCKKCKVYKPKRAHHCSQCRRCIIKMDHHCPWVNNCVGINNHKLFILFLLYTFTSCFYCLILVICYSWGNIILDDENTGSNKHNTPQLRGSNRNHVQRTHPEPPSMGTVFLVFVVVEAILFGLFTCCMLTEQWSNVVDNNETTVERIIRERNEKQRKEKEMLLHHEAGSDDSDIISSDSHGEEKKQSAFQQHFNSNYYTNNDENTLTDYDEVFGSGYHARYGNSSYIFRKLLLYAHWLIPFPVQFPNEYVKNLHYGYFCNMDKCSKSWTLTPINDKKAAIEVPPNSATNAEKITELSHLPHEKNTRQGIEKEECNDVSISHHHEYEPLIPSHQANGRPYLRNGVIDLSMKNMSRIPHNVEMKELTTKDGVDGSIVGTASMDSHDEDEECSDEECNHNSPTGATNVKADLKDNMNQYWIQQYQPHGTAIEDVSNSSVEANNNFDSDTADNDLHAIPDDEDSQKKAMSPSFVSVMPSVVFDYATTTATGAWSLLSSYTGGISTAITSDPNNNNNNNNKKLVKKNDLLLYKAPLLHRKRTPPNDVYAMI